MHAAAGSRSLEPMGFRSNRSSTVAGVLFTTNGIFWSIAGPYFAVRIRRLGKLPVSGRIELFSGPIHSRFGPEGVTRALVPFGLLGFLEVLAGYWLLTARREGAVLGLALLPISMVFWIGLGLPIWFLGGPLRSWLVVKALQTAEPASA